GAARVDAAAGEAPHEVGADEGEDGGGDGGGGLRRQVGEHGRTGEGAHGAGDGEAADDLPVDVAETPVGDAGDEGGARFGGVDNGAGGRGAESGEHDEDRGGGGAETHAEAAVDELGGETREGDEQECGHGGFLGEGG